MLFLCDQTLSTPQENLAADEALLDLCERGEAEAVLRFWEPRSPFVVVGYGNQVSLEVNTDACQRRGIPVLRRCSGGGTVLQEEGCLNYSVILQIGSDPKLSGIPGTNDFVMERVAKAVSSALGQEVQRQGHTDLTLNGRKFCGNAQRRKKRCLIFHGCLLLTADLALIGEVLNMPSKQPGYRHNRSHSDFLTNLGVAAGPLKRALAEEWGAVTPLPVLPMEDVERLLIEKYNRPEWHSRL